MKNLIVAVIVYSVFGTSAYAHQGNLVWERSDALWYCVQLHQHDNKFFMQELDKGVLECAERFYIYGKQGIER